MNANIVPRQTQPRQTQPRQTQPRQIQNTQPSMNTTFEEQLRERENTRQQVMDVRLGLAKPNLAPDVRNTQETQQFKENSSKTKQYSSQSMNKIQDMMNQLNVGSTNELKQQIEELTEENRLLKEKIEEINFDKILELKEQIANEWSSLTKKTEEVDREMNSFTEREMIVKQKEINLKNQMEKFEWLLRTKQVQLEISNNKSSYNYPVNMENVIGIKLLSYSLPISRYNIEVNKNNEFKFIINEEEKVITLNNGKYCIESLLNKLNEKLKEINNNLTIYLNDEQMVILESSNEEDKILVNQTILSNYNLGFDLNQEELTNKVIGTKPWDLRMEDRVYLYLTNLADNVPFGVLYLNNQTEQVCQWTFESPYKLNELNLRFKDSRGLDYNFNGLEHTLSFVVCKL
jgi:hypothetical protein